MICGWLHRHVAEARRPIVQQELEARAGPDLVAKVCRSEELLAYLERRAFDERAGVEAREVQALLARGAQPNHTQNGATALLLVVLNPYSTLRELEEVFRAMLEVTPQVAAMRDGFEYTPLQWAADYTNIAMQHGLDPPNPAALLALMPCLVNLLPEEVDGGAVCLKATSPGQCPMQTPRGASPVRFMEGDRVICRVEVPGGNTEWEEGVVTGLWYREGCWPISHPGAPYEIKLDIGTRLYALVDHERIVRREVDGAPPLQPSAEPPQSQQGTQKTGAQAGKGPRFQKRRCTDGTWEMLDTVSGKTRPCPAPDSDSDE